MYKERFSPWVRWAQRNTLPDVGYPGVYAIARSTQDLSGLPFSWSEDIIYIGMTNAVSGLRGRLKQFDDTINGRRGHGGAVRVRFRHRDYAPLVASLFVSVHAVKCDVKSNQPVDLRKMGRVAEFEYLCFAHFAELFERLPEFNDKKRSPKRAAGRLDGVR